MPVLELPGLAVERVVAVVASGRPVLINRDPAPDEVDVPLGTAISLQVVDPGPDGIDRALTRVWVDGALAFDGGHAVELRPGFDGPAAGVVESADTLFLTVDPVVPLGSEAVIAVRVMSATRGGAGVIDEAYAFTAEDRTAPRLVAAQAVSPRAVRVACDEGMASASAADVTFDALDVPAVPIAAVSAAVVDSVVTIETEPEMSPDVRYRVRVAGALDRSGNEVGPPYDEVVFAGYRPPRPARRRFDLWSMLPTHNRRIDTTGDLERFVACLQEVVDLLFADLDRFVELFELERAPEPFVDLILRDLGSPFSFDLGELEKRRLAAVLVQMYRQKGTAVGIRNAVRFLLGLEIEIVPFAADAMTLGESELGVGWVLGPSGRFARYAFNVEVDRVLSTSVKKRLRTLVEYLMPAHTHFVDLLEPSLPQAVDHWVLGVSELGESSVL